MGCIYIYIYKIICKLAGCFTQSPDVLWDHFQHDLYGACRIMPGLGGGGAGKKAWWIKFCLLPVGILGKTMKTTEIETTVRSTKKHNKAPNRTRKPTQKITRLVYRKPPKRACSCVRLRELASHWTTRNRHRVWASETQVSVPPWSFSLHRPTAALAASHSCGHRSEPVGRVRDVRKHVSGGVVTMLAAT